jgi:hypothetical protein
MKPVQITALPERPEDELHKQIVKTFMLTIAMAFGVPGRWIYPPYREFNMEALKKALEDLDSDDS